MPPYYHLVKLHSLQLILLCLVMIALSCDKDDAPDDPPLMIPAIPTIQAPGDSQMLGNCVLIDWEPIEDALYYEIRISSSPEFESNYLVDSRYVEEDPFVDVTLAVFDLYNEEYYVRMSAGNAVGESAWSQVISFTVNANGNPEICYEAPEAPILVLPDQLGVVDKDYIELEWQEVEIATHYIVQFSDSESFDDIQYERDQIETAEHQLQSLNPIDIYWRVKAVRYNVEGDWSEVWMFRAE